MAMMIMVQIVRMKRIIGDFIVICIIAVRCDIVITYIQNQFRWTSPSYGCDRHNGFSLHTFRLYFLFSSTSFFPFTFTINFLLILNKFRLGAVNKAIHESRTDLLVEIFCHKKTHKTDFHIYERTQMWVEWGVKLTKENIALIRIICWKNYGTGWKTTHKLAFRRNGCVKHRATLSLRSTKILRQLEHSDSSTTTDAQNTNNFFFRVFDLCS